MKSLDEHQQFIIEWNRKFPLDRWWREKYSIPLFSSRHLETNQIDIMYEYLEEVLIERGRQESIKQKEREKNLAQGIWLKVEDNFTGDEEKLFDSLDLNLFNKKKVDE